MWMLLVMRIDCLSILILSSLIPFIHVLFSSSNFLGRKVRKVDNFDWVRPA